MATEPMRGAPMGELAKPENLLVGRLTGSISAYADVLIPTDEVLRSRGGIENLKIYRELLRDDQVASTFQQRRLAVTSKEWKVDPGADDAASVAAADELRRQLERLPWDAITDKMLFSSFYGWSVAEILWKREGSLVAFDQIIVRERSRFRFGWSGALYLQTLAAGLVAMPERKFWTVSTGADHSDEPYGLGLAHSLYWPVFFKRNGVKFWLTFLERFGQPTAIAKMPAASIADPNVKSQALQMLRQIATDAGVLVPDSVVSVELLEATRSGTGDYDSLRSAMDAAIAKIVLSQTMTTDNGSSRSQSETHKSVRDEVVRADADLVCESFMRGPVRWWTEWNFPGAVMPVVYRDVEPPEDLNARAERDTKVAGLGYEPTEDYIRETYGDGWQKKAAPPAPPPGALAGLTPGAVQNPDDPAFAEGESAALRALKVARRMDQNALLEAATHFAEQYETVLARRVGQLLEAADDSGDFDTFRARIDELLAEPSPGETVDKLTRAGFFSRLMGAARSQRKGAA